MNLYIVATTSGSYLVDASGRATGPDITRVISKHRTLLGAYRSQRQHAGVSRCPAILTADGKRLSDADVEQLDALQSGAR